MRTTMLAFLATFALGACSEAEPPKPAAPPPVKPLAQPAPPPAAPVPAPAPSADELLLARVTRALRDARAIDAQGVDVTVSGGTVSLFGTAASEDARRAIERFVAGLDGVQAVVNKLVVVRGS